MIRKLKSFGISLSAIFLTTLFCRVSYSSEESLLHSQCPVLNSAEDALTFFIEADKVGARLTSTTVSNLKECVSFENEVAWDKFQVISSYEIKPCSNKQGKNNACFEVKYAVLGELVASLPFEKFKDLKFVTYKYQVNKQNQKWELKMEGDLAPTLSKEGAISYLTHFQDKKNSKLHNDWLKTSALAIESAF